MLVYGYPIELIIILGLIALAVGSFLNVVIYRLPKMLHQEWLHDCRAYLAEVQADSTKPHQCPACLANNQQAIDAEQTSTVPISLCFPRSSCPNCQCPIRWRDNIPVLSYLWLKGKCHACQHAISIRYPLIELTSLLLVYLCLATHGFSISFFFAIIFSWSLLAAAMIDFDTQLLPDSITQPLLWIGLLANTWHTFASLEDAIWGAVSAYLVIYAIFYMHKLITRREGMGHGDFKLFAVLGAWFGWQALPMIFFISSLSGSIVGLSLIILGKKQLASAIPFGPYIVLAGFAVLFIGDQLSMFMV